MKDFSKGYRRGRVIVVITNTEENNGFSEVGTEFKSINQAKFANRSLQLPTATKADGIKSVCQHCGTVTRNHVDTCIMGLVIV